LAQIQHQKDSALRPKELKPPIQGLLPIAIAALAWHFCVSAQVEHRGTSRDRPLSATASCYEESTGKLIGSNKSHTSVLMSADERYRAYAESEAVASNATNANGPECQNTSRLFVAGPKSEGFRPVLSVEPSAGVFGNSIDLVD
jgi:hypothetical protein